MQHSQQTTQDKGDHEISLQLLNIDQNHDVKEEHEWLSDQFKRLPYMLYKFWLVLTFIIALSIQPHLILSQFSQSEKIDLSTRWGLVILSISLLLILLGCCEMLFAMVKRKSAFAQKSLVKLQYSIVGTIFGLVLTQTYDFDFNKSFLFEASVMVALPTSLIVSSFGALAVLRAFRNNHPLARLQGSQDVDFLEQNEAIASELSKYDEQLDRWPYQVYRFWLKFVIVLGIMIIAIIICYQIPFLITSQNIKALGGFVPFLLICAWTTFCCYEMEVVLKTKTLEKSKNVLFHLKMCLFMFIIPVALQIILYGMEFFALKTLLILFAWILFPLITLIGAFSIDKIIEERERFAKVSSYSGDHYLR